MTSTRRQLLQGAGAAALLTQIGAVRREARASAESAAAAGLGRYSLEPGLTYLNHASVGTVPRVVQAAHEGYLRLCETNPWLHMWSDPWVEPREAVRARAASTLGCGPDEVAIVHNTTECFNLLAQGLPLGGGDEVLFSSLNHAGASVCWEHHGARRGYAVRRFPLPLDEIPAMSTDELVERHVDAIGERTRALVLPHVDNVVGVLHPVARIAALARERGVRWILVDGAQTVGMLPVDVRALDADVFATSAHKWLQAPKGLGLAYLRRELQADVEPMWVTWGQERWRGDARVFEDYGTRALPAVLALGDAIDFQSSIPAAARADHYRRLRRHLGESVGARPTLEWRSPAEGSDDVSLVSIGLRDRAAPPIAARLFREHGVVVRPFSMPGLEALRVSANLMNDEADLERLVEAVA